MKKTAWIGCACLLALAGCGGASNDDGRDTTTRGNNVPEVDAGDDDEGSSDDDEADDDEADDDEADDDADDDVTTTPVEDDDLVAIADDDLFVPVEDDDFTPVEPPVDPDDDLVVSDDDVVTMDDDTPAMDDDAPAMDDDAPAMDDDAPAMDDDAIPEPMMPADDDVIEPEVDPGGCQLVGQSLGPTYCQLNEQCDGRYRYSYCSDLGNGSWSCQCSNNYTYQYFELSGVDQNTACPAVRDLCNEGVVPEFTGEPVCEPAYQSINTDYCQTSESCRRTADIGDGIVAVETQSTSNYCYNNGDGTIGCSCSGMNRSLSYTLSGVPIADACNLGMGLCTGDDVVFDGEPMCTTGTEYATTSYCQVQRNCGQTADLGDGVIASLTQPEYSYCQFSSAGPAVCNCQASGKYLRFQMDAEADVAACNSASAICQSTTEIVPEGPIVCTQASQSASTTYCNANIECAQEANVDGTVIGVYGNISAYCQPNGDVWSCSCQSNIDSATIEVATADSWDACTAATEQCPELVEVDVTASGGGYYVY